MTDRSLLIQLKPWLSLFSTTETVGTFPLGKRFLSSGLRPWSDVCLQPALASAYPGMPGKVM